MRRSARNVPRRVLVITLCAGACGTGSRPDRWFEVVVHGVPVGAESWTEVAPGSWDRRVALDYLVDGVRRTTTRTERCTGDAEALACPSGPIAVPGDGPEQRRPSAVRPAGPPREVLAALVIPAPVPDHAVGRLVFSVDGAERVVEAADRLEIPAGDRALLDRWVAEAQQATPGDLPPEWAAGGPCVQQAAALVGLARAHGAPAELVTGRVLRVGPVGPGLYPHAWAEVSLGGHTWSVDPALAQVPADAGHVALARGTETPRLELSVWVVDPPPPLARSRSGD
jgi:hypothetical protein